MQNNKKLNNYIDGGLRCEGNIKKSSVNSPLITVVTVVYNGEKFLDKTIESVIKQDYNNLEFIIVDGGSTDYTINIIKKYEDEIDYWISEKDEGIYDAMNKGLTLANGDWIYYLGADDTLKNFSDEIKNALKNKEVDIILGTVNAISSEGVRLLPRVQVNNSSCFYWKSLGWPHQGQIIRKEKHTGFDKEYKLIADNKLLLMLYRKKAKTFISRDVIANYSLEGISTLNKSQRLKEWKKLFSFFDVNTVPQSICDRFWFFVRKIQIKVLEA